MATNKRKKDAPKKAPKKAAKKAAKKTPKKISYSKAAKKKAVRKPNAAFMATMAPSPALSAVIGSKALPRTEAVKKLWAYIKANKLQDNKDRRMINADAKLKPLFSGKPKVSMFDLAKVLNKNMGPIKPPQ